MEANQRIDELEGDLRIVKNEVQSVLLDIREYILSNHANPFPAVDFSKNSSAKKNLEASAPLNVNVDNADKEQIIEQNQPERMRDDVHGEGAKLQGDAAGTDQVKSLVEQLQHERQALQQERKETNQFGALPDSAHPQWAHQAVPVFQSVPGTQPVPVVPTMQSSQATPGFQPVPSASHRMERVLGQRSSEMDGRKEGESTSGLSSFQGMRPRGRALPERGDAKGASGKMLRKDSGSSRSEERSVSSHEKVEGVEVEQTDLEKTQVNLLTLVGLVRWVEKGIQQVGKERVEAIVEIYQTAGYLPARYKDVIPQIIRLAEGDKPEGPVTMGDSISVLLQLDSLLGGKFKTESVVLSTLFDDDGGYPWTKQ